LHTNCLLLTYKLLIINLQFAYRLREDLRIVELSWDCHQIRTESFRTPQQLNILAAKPYYIERFHVERLAEYRVIVDALDEAYPGDGPYATAACEFTDAELQQYKASVQKPTIDDDEDACIDKVKHAIRVLSNIIANRNLNE
jgi:hypothetical protein